MKNTDYRELSEKLIKFAKNKGATETQVSISGGTEFSVEVRNGKVERLQEASSTGIGIKIIVNKRVAGTSSSDLTEATLFKLIEGAVNRAKLTSRDEFSGLPEKVEKSIDPSHLQIYDELLLQLSPEKKIEYAREIEKIALSDKRIRKSAGSSFSTGLSDITIANSNGFYGTYSRSSCSAGITLQAGEGENMIEDWWYSSAVGFKGIEPAETIANKAVNKVVQLLGAKKIPTQKVPVVFDPYMTSMLLGFLSSCLYGSQIYMNKSYLVNKLGEKIASDLVTVTDDPHIPSGLGSRPFDAEGVPTNKLPVIEKGVLKNYFLDTYSGKKLKMPSNGRASGTTNLFIEKGKYSPEEIIKSVDKGLLIVRTIGQGTVPTTGDISKGAYGLWLENGQVAFPVSEVTFSGNLDKLLKNITMIGNDLKFDRSIAGPTIRIEDVTISGK